MSLALDLSLSAGQWQVNETTVTLPASQAWTQLLAPNPLRWAAFFGLALGQTGPYCVSTRQGLANGANKGFLIPTNTQFTGFTYDAYGGMVGGYWFGASNAAAQNIVTVIEVVAVQQGVTG